MFDIEEHLLDDLRRVVTNVDASAHPWRFALRQRLHLLRRRLPGRGALALTFLAAAAALAAVAVLVVHWPPGGGEAVSELAIAQGASLVFVVLLLSLVPGPVEAARTIGWEPTWILRDRITWVGFSAVAVVSLAELTIAWSRPEHAEEGATILLTSAGVAVTGLLARRLLRMSDPATQLSARVESQIPRLVTLIARERKTAERRARQQGIEAPQARLLTITPHPGAQSGMAGVLRPMFGFATRSIHDGRWDQAQQAHVAIARVVIAYVAAGRRITLQDRVLDVFAARTNDLHELASGPHGRDLCTTLFDSFSRVGNAIARSHLQHEVREGGAFHRLAFTANLMVRRRLGDDNSTDPGHGLTVIGELATLASQVGDGATAVGIGDDILQIAVPATNARLAHIAEPAWRSAIKILRRLSLGDAETRDSSAIDMWAEGMATAIATLRSIPTILTYSGAEPLLQLDPVEPPLITTFFHLWMSDLDRHSKQGIDLRIGDAFLAPLLATEEGKRHRAAEVVSEVWHQMACAAASSAIAQSEDSDAAVQAIARKLGLMRSLWTSEEASAAVIHSFVTDWIVALYITRESNSMPDALANELAVLEAAFADAASKYPRGPLAEARAWLAEAFQRANRKDTAARVASWEIAEEPSSSSSSLALAGLFGGRRLHRGLVIAPVVVAAEAWWLGTTG